MCTVCRAGAKGGETQNIVVVEESLVELSILSRFFEMLCQGAGRLENLLTELDRAVLEGSSRLLRRSKRFLDVQSLGKFRADVET